MMADAKDRPLSPHLQIWRFHITMAVSILHRITGVGLYLGALMGAGWALALAGGPVTYDGYMRLLGSPLGKFVLFGMTVSMFFHMGNGVRHLFWDSGEGFEVKTADFTGWLVVGFSIAASVFTWILAFMSGAL
jgi:succinate dehydrogenase / fumarate reductase cytochrome b subunit